MKIHLRQDKITSEHSQSTLFINGRNCGSLTMSPDQFDWFYIALERGVHELNAPGLPPFDFVGSGASRGEDVPIPPLPSHTD